jgi:hypothetical protein
MTSTQVRPIWTRARDSLALSAPRTGRNLSAAAFVPFRNRVRRLKSMPLTRERTVL